MLSQALPYEAFVLPHLQRLVPQCGLAFTHSHDIARNNPFLLAAQRGDRRRTVEKDKQTATVKSSARSWGFLGPGKALNRRGCGGRQGA